MSIYSVFGNEVFSCYDVDGTELYNAYDVGGNEVFAPTPTNTFNVMTYNVQLWGGRNGNETLVREIFSSTNPLLVGLQECRGVGTGGYVPDTFAYGAVGTKENVNNPTAIMSNVAFTDFTAYSFTNGITREYTKCYVTIGGKRIAWFNTHMDYYTGEFSPTSNHALQMNEIFDVVSQEDSFILTGDFNCYGAQEYNDCIKPFVDAGYNLCNWTNETGYVDTWFQGFTVDTATDKQPCDNIITSADLTITNIEYNTAKLSLTSGQIDHIPIIATIVIPNAQS